MVRKAATKRRKNADRSLPRSSSQSAYTSLRCSSSRSATTEAIQSRSPSRSIPVMALADDNGWSLPGAKQESGQLLVEGTLDDLLEARGQRPTEQPAQQRNVAAEVDLLGVHPAIPAEARARQVRRAAVL